jgi:hypothetical protein
MSSNLTHAIIVVSPHWIVGSIPSNGKRIQDVLKDPSTNFVRLTDVHIYSDADCTLRIATLPQAVFPKDRIELVILPEFRHEAPITRWNNFSVRKSAKVSAIVSKFYIEGELQLSPSTTDVTHALTQQLGTFFPITRASLIAPDVKRMSAPVLFPNKCFLSCFSAEDAPQTENDAAELQSSLT